MVDLQPRSGIHVASIAGSTGVRIVIAAGILLLSLGGPLVAAAQRGGESWNDQHMRSNSARRLDPSPPRPPIRGTNRFEQSARNSTEAPPTTVPETTLQISPHEWAPGGASARAAGASAPSSRSSVIGGIRGGAAPVARSGIHQRSSGSRSSSLRSSSSRRDRGTRR